MFTTLLLRAVVVATGLLAAALSAPVMAQELQPFVMVPDGPGGGGGGGGRGDAVATANVNVRSGPGTNHPVVAVLRTGDRVSVNRCNNGWCFIDQRGPSGWVTQRYLRMAGSPGGGGSAQQVCFYEDPRFRGRSFCARPGDSDRNLGAWNNRISSITVAPGLNAEVCTDRDRRNCEVIRRDSPTLPWWLDRNVSSYWIFWR